MASKRELEALIVLAGKIDPSLQNAIRKANKGVGGLKKEAQLFGKVADKAFNLAGKAVAGGAISMGLAMVWVGKRGLDLASDLAEVQNVVDVTFGQNSKAVDTWSKTALKSFGLGELSAKQYSSTIGAMMKSSGISNDQLVSMSENLTALSGDFSSFYNLPTAEAFEKIRAGISGETEPLKQLGINMNVANLEAFALAHGIKTAYAKMSQADQTILRYNYLLETSKDAQGDFARTQGSLANQQRLFGESFNQLSAKIMSAAVPAFTTLMKKGNELIDSFANNPEKMAKLQEIIATVVDKVIAAIPIAINIAMNFASILGTVFNVAADIFNFIYNNWSAIEPLIIGIVGAMVLWKAATTAMQAYQAMMVAIRVATAVASAIQWAFNAAVMANPMTWVIIGVIAAVAGLVAGIYLLWKNWDQVSGWIVGLWQDTVMPFFDTLGGWFSGIWDGISGGFKGFVNLIIQGINFLIRGLNALSFDVPKFFGGGHVGFDVPEIPLYARGGFANQPSIFGEAGPEAAIPLKRTPRSLGLLNKTAQMLGVGGGTSGATFVFAPVIQGGGGGSIMAELKALGDDMFAQFDLWLEAKRRESFDG